MNDYDYNDKEILFLQELRKQYSVLDSYLSALENKIKHYEKGTATVYSHNQPTYTDLELKLKNFETNKQKDIDELFETRITPLNKKVMQLTQELTTSVNINQSQKSKIRKLEIVRDNLNTMIDFAVGYISATQPHTDKHPMGVKKWLFKGFEGS
jgi:predicted transcriptional regulator